MFKTYYKLKIEGLNLHHIIAYFEKYNILLKDLCRTNHKTLEITLNKKDYKLLKKSNIYTCFKITIIKKLGYENILKQIFYKSGIFIGITICLFSTLNFSNSIYSISFNDKNHTCTNLDDCIYNNKNKELLINTLKNYGLYSGAKSNNISAPKIIEQELIKTFPQIAGATITRKGVYVQINIIEAKLNNPLSTNALIAKESGIITELEVTNGQSIVNVGDIVIKGDVLVSEENNLPVVAKATIRTFYKENIIYNENQTTFVRTNRRLIHNDIQFLGLNLPSKKECFFNLYESETSSKYAFLNLILPIKLKQTIFYELEKQEQTIPYEIIQDNLKQNLKSKIISNMPNTADIINTTYTEIKEGSRTLLTCFVEALLHIEKK